MQFQAVRRAFQVAAPITPSAARFFFSWKFFTDHSVAGPKSPSAVSRPAVTLPPRGEPLEMSRVWAFVTTTPVAPFFSNGSEMMHVTVAGSVSGAGTAAGAGVSAKTAVSL